MHYVTSVFELTLHSENRTAMYPAYAFGKPDHPLAQQDGAQVLSDEVLTHLLWIDSDITFTAQFVCCLLLIDRDVTTGVYCGASPKSQSRKARKAGMTGLLSG